MKLAELIIAEARERGLRHFFGLPGGGSPLDMMEAGRRYGVDFISTAHESTAGIAAAYYGLMKQTAGLALSVKGVGAANLAGGAANAYFERVPVVCLSETSPGSVTQRDMVQHCDHATLFGAVTKFRATLSPDAAPQQIRDAVAAAVVGRPGPVLLNLPSDLGTAEAGDFLGVGAPPSPPEPHPARLAEVRAFVESTERLLVIAGTDVVRHSAGEALLHLVEACGAALLVNMDARGVFPESHPRWAGVLMGNYIPGIAETEIMDRADGILLVGADSMMTHVPFATDLPTCELVADEAYETLSPQPQVRVDGDLKAALESLSDLQREGLPEADIAAAAAAIMPNFERPQGARFAALDVIEIIREQLPADGVLVAETGVFVPLLERVWRVDRCGAYLGTAGGRTMGLTLPALLGAKLAAPEVPMIGLGADGSLLMRLGELEAFARTGVAAPIVIVNDQALGTMKSRQKARGMAEYELDLHSVDLAATARACGLEGVVAPTPEELEKALGDAMDSPRTTLLDARVAPQPYQDGFGPMVGLS